MKTVATSTSLRARFDGALPTVALKAGRDVLKQLVVDVLRVGAGGTVDEALADAFFEVTRELELLEVRFEEAWQALRAAVTTGRHAEGARDAAALAGLEGTRWRRRAVSAEAVQDRLALARQETLLRVSYLTTALTAGTLQGLPGSVRRSLLQRAMELLRTRSRPWTLGVEAIHLVTALCVHEVLGHPARRLLIERALRATEDPWVIAACARRYVGLPEGDVAPQRILSAILQAAKGTAPSVHLFARARVATLCGELVIVGGADRRR